jgi:hypothetical protein
MPARLALFLASLIALFFLAASVFGFGQTAATVAHPLVKQSIDEKKVVTLLGNTRPEVRTANDLGTVLADLRLEHMYLLMNRSYGQQDAIDELINKLHDQKSSMYHRWLTAKEVGEKFGPAQRDVDAVGTWLESHGFTVNAVYLANGVIDFSGSAKAVTESFHTEIHNLDVNGEHHIANFSDPKIPSALAPAVSGVVSLNDFRPHPLSMRRVRPNYTVSMGNSPYQAVVPGDLSRIYNFDALYAAGVSGEGQTIVVLEDSDVFTASDWHTFRKIFGLDARFPKGSFRQIHPQPSSSPGPWWFLLRSRC